jgi:hypothetical protein
MAKGRRIVTVDPEVGQVVEFIDSWNGRRASCLLVGEGPGPEGESVRLVGYERGAGGFAICYVRSYEPGSGNAAAAYRYLLRERGELVGLDVATEEGLGFNRRMLEAGVLSRMQVTIPGREEIYEAPGAGPKP